MRQWPALLVGLLSCVLAGCVSGQPARTSTSWLQKMLHPAGPSGPDAVQMDVALIERPLGDRYLNKDLWMDADEQIIASEDRAILEDNGFRIGQIGGITPVGLQALLTSDHSCADPRRLRTPAGKPTKLMLGPQMDACRFQIRREDEPLTVALEQAQCTLEVVPALTPDGRIRLRLLPLVYHGAAKMLPRPAADRSGWILQEERPVETYKQLAWEVTLASNEYLVVGGRYDKPMTLGHQCFIRTDEQAPVQRLLVIRTTRAGQGLDNDPFSPLASGEPSSPHPQTLATQASQATVRGSSR